MCGETPQSTGVKAEPWPPRVKAAPQSSPPTMGFPLNPQTPALLFLLVNVEVEEDSQDLPAQPMGWNEILSWSP